MQEETAGTDDNATASVTSSEHSSPHHFVADAASGQSLPETTHNDEVETQAGAKKSSIGEGYERVDPREMEEARLRAQQPSEYAGLQADKLEDLYTLPKKKKR